MTAEAAANHPGVGYFVAAPLGLHPLMTTIVDSRLETCLAHLTAGGALLIFSFSFLFDGVGRRLERKQDTYSHMNE